MQCFVLMRNRDPAGTASTDISSDDCEWATQRQTSISSLVANMGSPSIKDAIVKTIRTLEVNMDRFHCVQLNAFYMYGQVFEIDVYQPESGSTVKMKQFFALSTDTPLDKMQLIWLRKYVLESRLSLQEIIDKLEEYIVYHEALVVRQGLQETTDIMIGNLSKIDLRGDMLHKLLADTEQLAVEADIFRHNAEELNSCWPQFCFGWLTLPSLPALPKLPWPFG